MESYNCTTYNTEIEKNNYLKYKEMIRFTKLLLVSSGFCIGMIFEYCFRVNSNNKYAIICGVLILIGVLLKIFEK